MNAFRYLVFFFCTSVLAIEDPNTGHGALQLDPRNGARMLDSFLK